MNKLMQKLVSKLKGIPRFQLIVLLVVAVIIIGSGAYFLITAKSTTSTQTSTPPPGTKKVSLMVESEPNGIAMTSEPDCDASQSQKITPYTCEVMGDVASTLVTAPQEVSQNGKTYLFQNWEGCNEPNENKILCRVTLGSDTQPTIKAIYSEQQSSAATNNAQKTKPNTPAGKNNDNTPAPPTSQISSRQCQDSLTIDTASNTVTCVVQNPYEVDMGQTAFTNPPGALGTSFTLPITIRCSSNCTLKQGSSSQEIQGNVATTVNSNSTYGFQIYDGGAIHISVPYTTTQTANQQQVTLKFEPFTSSSSTKSYEIYIPAGYGGIGYVYHLAQYYVRFSYSEIP